MEGYVVDSGIRGTRRRLRKAGFRADNLEAMTEVIGGMEERPATKDDLAKAQGALAQELADVCTELGQELTASFDGVRGELRMVKWVLCGLFALMVPMLGGIIGIALQLARQ